MWINPFNEIQKGRPMNTEVILKGNTLHDITHGGLRDIIGQSLSHIV